MRKGVVLVIICLFIGAIVPINILTENVKAVEDLEPPSTTLYFDSSSGIVTFLAIDFGSGIKATYYIINGGDIQIYTSPFKLCEGNHSRGLWRTGCSYLSSASREAQQHHGRGDRASRSSRLSSTRVY